MANMFGPSIRQRTFIAAPIEKVFDTITDASHWDRFFTTGMTLEPRAGGKCIFRWKDWGPDRYTTEADGRVVTYDHPGLFAFEWYPIGTDYPTTVSFKLEPQGNGTILTIEETGYPDTERSRAMILECASGWGEAATLLKFYIEHGLVYGSID